MTNAVLPCERSHGVHSKASLEHGGYLPNYTSSPTPALEGDEVK